MEVVEMKKLVLCSVILALLLTILPLQALAATAQLDTAQAYADAMAAEGIKYTWLGVNEDNNEKFSVLFIGDEMEEIDLRWFFTENSARLYVWNIITYDPADYYDVLEAVNALNNQYGYACFYADTSDNTVNYSYNFRLDPACAGQHCIDVMYIAEGIVDESYPTLAPYNTAA